MLKENELISGYWNYIFCTKADPRKIVWNFRSIIWWINLVKKCDMTEERYLFKASFVPDCVHLPDMAWGVLYCNLIFVRLLHRITGRRGLTGVPFSYPTWLLRRHIPCFLDKWVEKINVLDFQIGFSFSTQVFQSMEMMTCTDECWQELLM